MKPRLGRNSIPDADQWSQELNNETMSLSEDYLPAMLEQFSGGVMPVRKLTIVAS